MQTACSIGEWLAGLFGAGWASTGWQDSKFLAPVLAGERLAVGGRVGAVDPHPAGARVAVELWVRDRSGTTTAIGRASGMALATDSLR